MLPMQTSQEMNPNFYVGFSVIGDEKADWSERDHSAQSPKVENQVRLRLHLLHHSRCVFSLNGLFTPGLNLSVQSLTIRILRSIWTFGGNYLSCGVKNTGFKMHQLSCGVKDLRQVECWLRRQLWKNYKISIMHMNLTGGVTESVLLIQVKGFMLSLILINFLYTFQSNHPIFII